MTSQSRKSRWFMVIAGMLVMALFVAACGGGDDATATPAGADETQTPAGVTQATPTQAAAATATDEATATTPAGTATVAATAAAAATSTPTSEATATTASEPTATTEVTATAVDEEDPLADIEALDPERLPNYTLSFHMEITGIPGEPEAVGEDVVLDMEIQQSALDNYYMLFDSADMAVEVWVVDEVTYVTQEDGTVVEVPGGEMSMFSPGMFVQTTQTLDPELEARRDGEETVSGRETTRYRINADDYLEMSELFEEGQVPDGASGEFVVWVDNELNIPIRYEADITWTNDDGSPGAIIANYLISDIDSTSRVEPPQ